MKRTLYEILGVDKNAAPELIAEAYRTSLARCEERLSRGDPDAQTDAVTIKDAYAVLSDPNLRTVYDARSAARLAQDHDVQISAVQFVDGSRSTFLSWWQTSKVGFTLIGMFVLLLTYLGLGYFAESNKATVLEQVGTADQETAAAAATNEGKLIEGAVRNEELAITHQAQILNRVVDVSEQRESRYRQELDYRAYAGARQLEVERRAQDARLEAQRSQQRLQEAQLESQRNKHAEEQRLRQIELERQQEYEAAQRAERARRYYTCLNAKIDEYGAARAQEMCASYK